MKKIERRKRNAAPAARVTRLLAGVHAMLSKPADFVPGYRFWLIVEALPLKIESADAKRVQCALPGAVHLIDDKPTAEICVGNFFAVDDGQRRALGLAENALWLGAEHFQGLAAQSVARK